MLTTITLRPVAESDEPFLYQLYCTTRNDELAALDWNAAQRETFLIHQFRAQQQHYHTNLPTAQHRIICYNGQAVGRLISAELADELRLANIAILPTHQGLGIGTALIQQVLDTAAKTGCVVRLHVEQHNHRARRLYQRLGFRIIEQLPTHYFMEANPSVALSSE